MYLFREGAIYIPDAYIPFCFKENEQISAEHTNSWLGTLNVDLLYFSPAERASFGFKFMPSQLLFLTAGRISCQCKLAPSVACKLHEYCEYSFAPSVVLALVLSLPPTLASLVFHFWVDIHKSPPFHSVFSTSTFLWDLVWYAIPQLISSDLNFFQEYHKISGSWCFSFYFSTCFGVCVCARVHVSECATLLYWVGVGANNINLVYQLSLLYTNVENPPSI